MSGYGSGPVEERDKKRQPSDQMNLRYNPMRYALEGLEPRHPNTKGLDKPSQTYNGIIMHWSYIDYKTFWEKHDNTFLSLVMGSKTPEDAKDANIVEAIVYIPEISGCLPLPEMKLIDRFISEMTLMDPSDASILNPDKPFSSVADSGLFTLEGIEMDAGEYVEKDATGAVVPPEWYKTVPKQIKRLDRFPRFYSINKGDGLRNGAMAAVEFPNKHNFSIGILKSIR